MEAVLFTWSTVGVLTWNTFCFCTASWRSVKNLLLAKSAAYTVILWSNGYRTGVSLHFTRKKTEGEESVETCQALSSKSHVCSDKALWSRLLMGKTTTAFSLAGIKHWRTVFLSFFCCVEWFHSASHRLQEEQNQSDGASAETRSVYSGCDWGETQIFSSTLRTEKP